jgi:hypothetical protein
LANVAKPKLNYCFSCAKCCFVHPCALEPGDLGKIARFLDLTEKELFNRFLVLDYVEVEGSKQYYVCPARKTDPSGTIVSPGWTFSDSPCIFLRNRRCYIQEVKPKGGRTYYCRSLTNTGQVIVAYDKKRAVNEWKRSTNLRSLLNVAVENKTLACSN